MRKKYFFWRIINRFNIILLLIGIFSCRQDFDYKERNIKIKEGFMPLWQLYNLSSGGGWENNDNGRMSNDDAAVLDGLILLYEVTKDSIYIDYFLQIAERIYNSTDINRGIKDSFRGNKILPGWSSTRYTKENVPHIFNVDNALIHITFVKLYRILKNEKKYVSEVSFLKIENLFKLSLKAFKEVFFLDWKVVGINSGYFHDPYYEYIGIDTPINQSCVFAIYTSELFLATGDKKFREYSQHTANYFLSLIKVKNRRYVEWNYNTTPPYWVEDIGHGSWVTWFIVHSFENQIAFDEEFIGKIINTFEEKIHKGNLKFAERIDGEGLSKEPVILHYFLLAFNNHENIKKIFVKYWEQRSIYYDSNSFLNHVGYHLIYYYALLNYYR